MEDYFNGVEFKEKETLNRAINTMRNKGIGTYCVLTTAEDCKSALYSYNKAVEMHGLFRGLMYAEKESAAWEVYADAYKATVYYMFHHIDKKVETA